MKFNGNSWRKVKVCRPPPCRYLWIAFSERTCCCGWVREGRIWRPQHAGAAAVCVLLLAQSWTSVSLNLWEKDLTKQINIRTCFFFFFRMWCALSKLPYHDCWLILPKKLPLAKSATQWRASSYIKSFSLVSKLNIRIRVILNWVKGQLNLRNWLNWAQAASGLSWLFLWCLELDKSSCEPLSWTCELDGPSEKGRGLNSCFS